VADDPQRPLLTRLCDELGMLGAELHESAILRCRLALLEIKADLRRTRRLAIVLATAGALGLAALPVLLVALAWWLDGYWGMPWAGWLLLFGAILVLTAPIIGLLGWRRFRRRFLGLEQTLGELREDAVWLQEWLRQPTVSSKQ